MEAWIRDQESRWGTARIQEAMADAQAYIDQYRHRQTGVNTAELVRSAERDLVRYRALLRARQEELAHVMLHARPGPQLPTDVHRIIRKFGSGGRRIKRRKT